MVTAKAKFISKKLAQKYGVIGKVASRYVAAGYSVNILSEQSNSFFDIIAIKSGEKYAIKVFTNAKEIGYEELKKIVDEATKIGAKPIAVLYGSGPRISEDALSKLDELHIKIKRVRP